MKRFSAEIDVAEVCTDDLPDVASDAGVVSIPTIQIWHASELKDTIIGCVAKRVLESRASYLKKARAWTRIGTQAYLQSMVEE